MKDELEPWLDPTPEMLESPQFEAIWQCIKSWDINVPSAYQGYCGATGNHVRAILDAIESTPLLMRELPTVNQLVRIIGGTKSKHGDEPIGARLWDVELQSAARNVLEALSISVGGGVVVGEQGVREQSSGDPSGNPLSPSGSSPQAVSPASPLQSGAGSES